jgi:hypothetical protein
LPFKWVNLYRYSVVFHSSAKEPKIILLVGLLYKLNPVDP